MRPQFLHFFTLLHLTGGSSRGKALLPQRVSEEALPKSSSLSSLHVSHLHIHVCTFAVSAASARSAHTLGATHSHTTHPLPDSNCCIHANARSQLLLLLLLMPMLLQEECSRLPSSKAGELNAGNQKPLCLLLLACSAMNYK